MPQPRFISENSLRVDLGAQLRKARLMTRNKNRADRRPTWTSLVLEALTASDDFATAAQLCAVTKANINQCSAALYHLRAHRAVDCLASDGQLFWFATPGNDDRSKIVAERTPEPKGNRTRRSAVKAAKTPQK